MEIITIESSDEESINKSGNSRLISPREFESDSCRCGSDSSSSHDSIWDKGLSRCDADAGSEQLANFCSQSEIHGKCDAVVEIDNTNVLMNINKAELDATNQNSDDESSLSSSDSLWEKIGSLKIDKILPAHKRDTVQIDTENQSPPCNVLNSLCSVSETSNEIELNHDESSVSSLDSILRTTCFEIKKSVAKAKGDSAMIVADEIKSNQRCNTQRNCKSGNNSVDSSVLSANSVLGETCFDHKKPARKTKVESVRCADSTNSFYQNRDKKQNCQTDSHKSDDSSVSSADSILHETYFERKKLPIHSYYDYCKYYPNNTSKSREMADAEKHDHTASRQTDKQELLQEFVQPRDTEWQIILLMDHREFGCSNNFLNQVEEEINKHFGRKQCEISTLPSADYLYVARLLSTAPHNEGEILQERVLDMVIERKAVQDVCQCLIMDSKKYKPLSFFEAQMYKLMCCGMGTKLFVMEGDEDKIRFSKSMMHGARSQGEKDRRLKRVKTLRLQLANDEFKGVKLICTESRHDTVKFLIHQLKLFQESFDPRYPPLRTRDSLKKHIERQMKAPTFLEYLRLRSIPSIGDAKAMKVIMDQNLDWDKNFVSPSSSKKSKATLEDRATFWKAPSSIQINTYIKAKSTKNSSRRKASANDCQTKVAVEGASETKSKINKKKSASTSKVQQHNSRTITSFFDQKHDSKSNGAAAVHLMIVSDDEKENAINL